MTIRISSEGQPLIAVIEDRTWTEFALCPGRLDLFFEPYRERAAQRAVREQAATRVCDQCPVQIPCRESGRRNHESGIWGGETEEERIRAGFPIRSVTRASLLAARQPAVVEGHGPTVRDPEVA